LKRHILIVDGNNVCHELFSLRKNSKVALANAQHLTNLLAVYANSSPFYQFEVELFFDGKLEPAGPGVKNLRIFPSADADDEIIQRVFRHVGSGNQVVVISGDVELRKGIEEFGARSISPFDFTFVHNPVSPRFIHPANLPFETKKEKTAVFHPENLQPDILEEEFPPEPQPVAQESSNLDANEGLVLEPAAESIPEPIQEPEAPQPVIAEEEMLPDPQKKENRPAVWYRAELSDWPVEEGARFLAGAFCSRHQAEAAALAHSGQGFRPDDLPALAGLLLSTCGSEVDFCKRGSLMDRVRLALLKHKGDWTPITRLAEEIGIPEKGLHGRIKRKAGSWVRFGREGEADESGLEEG
jgi:predicted RNA-binding protein with PIN domain